MKKNLEFPIFSICFLLCLVYCVGTALEQPQFTVVHTESDFEIRLYKDTAWMSAPVHDISFEKATREGFRRIYQYIHGANSNSTEFMMTAPVVTSVTPAAQKVDYHVRFYVSTKFNGTPPPPLPELNLQLSMWRTHCVAVRKFSGFASNDTIREEAEALATRIGKVRTGYLTGLLDKSSYMVAQYNASFHNVGRLNEVWMNFTGLAKGGCKSFKGILLFEYIQGANLNNSRISMTAPILTSVVSAGPFHSSSYHVRFFMPVKVQGTLPLPLPELKLRPVASNSHCIAVRGFSGFARDYNIVGEAEKLAVSLSKSKWANSTSEGDYAYSIAQYNSPFRFFMRVNEVWVDMDGSKAEGCQSDGFAAD